MKLSSLCAVFLLTGAAFGQQGYTAAYTASLITAASVVTVQTAAASSTTEHNAVSFVGAYVDCSVACTFTLEINGTPATTTSLALSSLSTPSTTPSCTAWSASNVGVGTVLGTYSLTAGKSIALDLSTILFNQGTNLSNLTIRTNSITGTVHTVIQFTEGGY